MKKFFWSRLIFSLLVGVLFSCDRTKPDDNFTKLITYPAPEDEVLSEDYTLEVNGETVDIYLAKIAEVENRPAWTLDPEDVGGLIRSVILIFRARLQ